MINFRLIRHLWLFMTVAEEQHFGRAAKRLGMSQPPLTTQIQVLEQALNVKLFDRSRRGATLTPVGAAILPAVHKFARQLERLELAVHEAAVGRRGVLTIGAISLAMLEELPPVVRQIKRDHPELTVSVLEIDSSDALPLLAAGDIDLAFARVEGDLGGAICAHPLSLDRLGVALPLDHPLAAQTEVSLSDLAGEDFILFARQYSPASFDMLMNACHDCGFTPRVLHEVRNTASQVALVGCGQGIALVPMTMAKQFPDHVVFRLLKEELKMLTTAVVWSAVRDNPVVSDVVAQLTKAA